MFGRGLPRWVRVAPDGIPTTLLTMAVTGAPTASCLNFRTSPSEAYSRRFPERRMFSSSRNANRGAVSSCLGGYRVDVIRRLGHSCWNSPRAEGSNATHRAGTDSVQLSSLRSAAMVGCSARTPSPLHHAAQAVSEHPSPHRRPPHERRTDEEPSNTTVDVQSECVGTEMPGMMPPSSPEPGTPSKAGIPSERTTRRTWTQSWHCTPKTPRW